MRTRLLQSILSANGPVPTVIVRGCLKTLRTSSFALLIPTLSLIALVDGAGSVHLQNAGFESSTPGEFWQVDKSDAKQAFTISVDRTSTKEGQQALLITAEQPVHLTLRQEIFLPIGT